MRISIFFVNPLALEFIGGSRQPKEEEMRGILMAKSTTQLLCG